jgi:hypothetical protein
MKHLLTFNVAVLCTEEEAKELKSDITVDPVDLINGHICTKLTEEELLDDTIDAVKLVHDRYKHIGV